jgi:hypothetical protein
LVRRHEHLEARSAQYARANTAQEKPVEESLSVPADGGRDANRAEGSGVAGGGDENANGILRSRCDPPRALGVLNIRHGGRFVVDAS